MFCLIGLPVITIFSLGKKASMPFVPTKILVAFLLSQIFAFPANAFDSCINVGMPFVCAYFKTGKLEYPPTPKTALGEKDLNMLRT